MSIVYIASSSEVLQVVANFKENRYLPNFYNVNIVKFSKVF